MNERPAFSSCARAVLHVAAWWLLTLLPGSQAIAHSDEYFDTRPSAHGGQTRMAGPIHLELVMQARQVTVYITDHADRPQPTAGGKAVLRVPARGVRLDLTAAGENAFSAPLTAALPGAAEIVVFVRLAGAEPQVARFGPAATVKPSAAEGTQHDHH